MRHKAAKAGGVLTELVGNYLVTAYKTGDKKIFDEALLYIQHEIKHGSEKFSLHHECANAEKEAKNNIAMLISCKTNHPVCKKRYNLLKYNPTSFTKQHSKFNTLREMIHIAKMQAVVHSQNGEYQDALSKLHECHHYIAHPEAQEMGFTLRHIEHDLMATKAVVIPKCMPLDEAIETIGNMVKKGHYHENIVEVLKELYIKKCGNDNGFIAYMMELKQTDKQELPENSSVNDIEFCLAE